MTSALGAAELRRALQASLDLLRARRAEIDAANVYPVPDGDTGTNLVLSFEAIVGGLDRTHEGEAATAAAVKKASLMGARGNSGVIMAQILRGWCEALGEGPAAPEQVASAFARGVELAYEAVLEPAEGTILTVARAASDAVAGSHPDVAAQFDAALAAASEALARTPEQLPVLARAGVVDAGGMGLVAVLEGFAATLNGREVARAPASMPGSVHPSELCEGSGNGFAYEVQYLLEAPDDRIPALRQLLGTMGDSVAVIGGEGTWRVHVHTDARDEVVALGRALGAVSSVETVEFATQMPPPRAEGPPSASARAAGERGVRVAEAAVSLVSVAAGGAMQRTFSDLGAIVVDGGRTMNPSVGDLIAAIERAPANEVIVLPNNDNVYAAAVAAKGEATGKEVAVLRTSDMAQGLAAALAFAASRDLAANVRDMGHAISGVRTGQVAIATRAGEPPEGPVSAGQALGFAEGAMVPAEGDPADPVAAACGVVGALIGPGAELLTVLCGQGVGEDERARLSDALRERFGALEIDIRDGGQPVHRYLISVE